MRKGYVKWLLCLMIALFLTGFTTIAAAEVRPIDLQAKLAAGKYVPKADNFEVIIDTSSSMTEPYKGVVKLVLARDFISRMNQTIPDMKISGALRKFGFVGFFSDQKTALVYGLTAYSKQAFEEALQGVKWASGDSPMATGINGATGDLKAATGRIAVIIVSDWDELGNAPATAAEDMKRQFGDRVCIYPVMVGNAPEGKKLMEKVVQAGQCGFVSYTDKIVSSEDMAEFVEKVFFTIATGAPLDTDKDGVPDYLDKCPGTPEGVQVDKDGCPLDSDKDGVPDYLDKCPGTPEGVKVDKDGCPLDSDKDGVPDYLDKCPGTPEGVQVDKDGCPLDSDKDGVPDYLDKCPGTPEGVQVDKDGCPLDSDKDGVPDYLDKCPGTPLGVKVDKDGCPLPEVVSITLKLEFDTAKSDIKAKFNNEIKQVADFMKQYPGTKAVIQGHTDNVGSEASNIKLSQARANSVRTYLIEKFGIEKDRLTAVGYGPKKPIASNATAEGKQKNRRVEAVIETAVKK